MKRGEIMTNMFIIVGFIPLAAIGIFFLIIKLRKIQYDQKLEEEYLESLKQKELNAKKRQLINGLLYDTEKSEVVFKLESKRLWYCMTESENCFIFNWSDDEITVISLENLKEKYADTDLDGYIKRFGAPEEA